MVIIERTAIVGRARSRQALVEALSRSNALNLTGHLDFNKYGKRDGVGFANVTEKFVDNFILSVLLPEYNTKNGANVFVGSQNRTIRELLNVNGLKNCQVKAIALCKTENPSLELLNAMPNKNKDVHCSMYFVQQFKIACPNVDYFAVLEFLRSRKYETRGFILKDFDVTLDYSGSFDKDEVIEHLVGTKNFKVQGEDDFASRVIIDNNRTVGRNCLTFMETVNGITTRQKIYNKMVQMLECKSVRSSVGCHWKDWVCQKDTRLAVARDKSTNRGLTRAEVTFYVKDGEIPIEDEIDSVLYKIVEYIPRELVFSTPYSAVWKSYCENFKHSLVCIDRLQDIGLVVYSYNELTENISGFVHENWSEKEKWCLEKLTLNGNLPLDVIDIAVMTRTLQSEKNGSKRKSNEILEITGTRYFKVNSDQGCNFTSRLVSKNGSYSFNIGTIESNSALLEKAGFQEQPNCIPYLAKSKASGTSKVGAILKRVEILDVQLDKPSRVTEDVLQQRVLEEAKKINEIRRPLLEDLNKAQKELKLLKNYTKKFSINTSLHLKDMELGSYQVEAAREQKTKYGKSYRLLVSVCGEPTLVWANSYINGVLHGLPKEIKDLALDERSGFLVVYNKPLAFLTITGRGTNLHGHTTVYCTFKIPEISGENCISSVVSQTKEEISRYKREMVGPAASIDQEIQVLSREQLIPYKEYQNLAILPLQSVHKIEAIGYVSHYGTDRLVVKLPNATYQAGEDLELKVNELKNNCYIKIIKIRTNIKRRIKFAESTIYPSEDYWTALVDYAKVPIFSKFDGKTCIVDVKTVEYKNQKRKLLLTDQNGVFKLKKSKLEEEILPGFY